MRALFVSVLLCSLSTFAMAQEKLAMRLNEKGIYKILQMAVKYNTSATNQRTVVIPQNLYKFTLKKADINSNPIVSMVSQFSNLNVNRDIDFYLSASDIRIAGNLDPASVRTTIFNSTPQSFDLKLNLSFPQIVVSSSKLSLCEDKQRNVKRCGNGLKANVTNLRIVTHGRPVTLEAVLRLKTDGGVARLKVMSVTSNLESRQAPNVDINFRSVQIPQVTLIVNGVETVLDTSNLRSEILSRKTFLGKKLLRFVGDYIASDFAEMLNVYLVNKQIVTSWQVFKKDQDVTFDEFLTAHPQTSVTYHRPEVPVSPNTMSALMGQIADVIRNAQMNISLKKMSTPGNKDIELGGDVAFILNNRQMNVRTTLGNSNRILPPLDLTSQRGNDVNLVISEPLINGALDLVTTTGLFQDVFDKLGGVQGFSVQSVRTHFTPEKSIIGVVNASIDLKKLQASNIGEWFKNMIAAFLERNNNKAVIYFPIEIEIIPSLRPSPTGGLALYLRVLSPFENGILTNDFHYPSNVDRMTDIVRDGVMTQLKENLNQYVNKEYQVELSRFLNQSGVTFVPKLITVNQAAYLLINLDISDIKFNSRNPSLR